MASDKKKIIPFDEHTLAKSVTINIKYVPTNKRSGDLCCYTYEIELKYDKLMKKKIPNWGFYFPGDVFVADPKTLDVSAICGKENSKELEYVRGKEGDPQVLYTKLKGDGKFRISFVSTSESSESTLLVLCVKGWKNQKTEWMYLNYENQFNIHGPRAR